MQFCIHCHATLVFRCPNCGHEQSEHHICEKCGTDIDKFWRIQLATAQAAHIKAEADRRERLENFGTRHANAQFAFARLVPLAAAALLPAPLGLIGGLLVKWLVAR